MWWFNLFTRTLFLSDISPNFICAADRFFEFMVLFFQLINRGCTKFRVDFCCCSLSLFCSTLSSSSSSCSFAHCERYEFIIGIFHCILCRTVCNICVRVLVSVSCFYLYCCYCYESTSLLPYFLPTYIHIELEIVGCGKTS